LCVADTQQFVACEARGIDSPLQDSCLYNYVSLHPLRGLWNKVWINRVCNVVMRHRQKQQVLSMHYMH
jgi:hypothetical protein